MPVPATLCISVEDEIVHGIPKNKVLSDGDIVGIDVGGDVLASGKEPGLASPLADSMMLSTINFLSKDIQTFWNIAVSDHAHRAYQHAAKQTRLDFPNYDLGDGKKEFEYMEPIKFIVREIRVATREGADSLLLLLDAGANFSLLAQQNSSINPEEGGVYGPFSKKQNKLSQVDDTQTVQDPLSVEDLLVDGTSKATITSDGRLLSKKDALKDKEEHIDLLKQREWGVK